MNFFFSPIKNEYGKIVINVRGVDIMNDDPSSVRVVYGNIESDAMQKISDAIKQGFANAG